MATDRKKKVKATGDAAPELVVTKPMIANLINILMVIFCVATIGFYAYTVYTFFSLDAPRWEAFVWSAVQAPFYIVPAVVVPMLRKDLIIIYATDFSGRSRTARATGKLRAFEDV